MCFAAGGFFCPETAPGIDRLGRRHESLSGKGRKGRLQEEPRRGKLPAPEGEKRRDSEARPLTYNPSVACSDSSPFRGAQTVKKPRRAREGRSPFELSIVPGGMYGGHGTVFASENPIFQRKKRFLAGSAPEKSSIFSGDWRGWQWRGSLLPRPPACQNFFDSLSSPFRGARFALRIPS